MITAVEPIRDADRPSATLPIDANPCPPPTPTPLARGLLLGADPAILPGGASDAQDVLRELAAYLASSLVEVEVGPAPLPGRDPRGALGLGAGGGGVEQIRLTFRVRSEADEDGLGEGVAAARERLGLTAREAEVLTLLARHHTNREIAEALVISVRTAEHHVAHILRKLGAPDRRAAAVLARNLAARRPLPLEPLTLDGSHRRLGTASPCS